MWRGRLFIGFFLFYYLLTNLFYSEKWKSHNYDWVLCSIYKNITILISDKKNFNLKNITFLTNCINFIIIVDKEFLKKLWNGVLLTTTRNGEERLWKYCWCACVKYFVSGASVAFSSKGSVRSDRLHDKKNQF